MTLTDSMMQKFFEPGLWFYKTYQPMTDISKMVYELSVKNGVPVTVLSSCNTRIQQSIIAMVKKDCIDAACNENERNWLEQEMSEYNTHGFFFHPQEMNDYVENGSFWSNYVHFNDEKWLNFSCCPYNVVIIEDSQKGIQAGVAAGVRVIAIRDKVFGIDQSQASLLVDSLTEAVQVIEKEV